MPLVKTSIQFSPGVSHYELSWKYDNTAASFKFIGLFPVNGTNAQPTVFEVGFPMTVRIRVVPICCDGCLGTPYEFTIDAVTPTTEPPTTQLPTTQPPTTEPTTTEPTTTDPDAPTTTTEPPYDYTGYYASPEEQFFKPHPSVYIYLKFRRPLNKANDRVRVFYRYIVNQNVREGYFDWIDNTSSTTLVIAPDQPVQTPNDFKSPSVQLVTLI